MQTPTAFEWDDKKAAINVAKHHVTFEFAAGVFLDPFIKIVGTIRPEDGETRFKAIGMIDGDLHAVVYTMRGETCRIISARRTNRKEERTYGNR